MIQLSYFCAAIMCVCVCVKMGNNSWEKECRHDLVMLKYVLTSPKKDCLDQSRKWNASMLYIQQLFPQHQLWYWTGKPLLRLIMLSTHVWWILACHSREPLLFLQLKIWPWGQILTGSLELLSVIEDKVLMMRRVRIFLLWFQFVSVHASRLVYQKKFFPWIN